MQCMSIVVLSTFQMWCGKPVTGQTLKLLYW